jgi:hypothetical protein
MVAKKASKKAAKKGGRKTAKKAGRKTAKKGARKTTAKKSARKAAKKGGRKAAKKGGRKYGAKASKKVGRVMHEFKEGTLKSGKGGAGGKVKSREQAIAIGISEARAEGDKVPKRPASRKKSA